MGLCSRIWLTLTSTLIVATGLGDILVFIVLVMVRSRPGYVLNVLTIIHGILALFTGIAIYSTTCNCGKSWWQTESGRRRKRRKLVIRLEFCSLSLLFSVVLLAMLTLMPDTQDGRVWDGLTTAQISLAGISIALLLPIEIATAVAIVRKRRAFSRWLEGRDRPVWLEGDSRPPPTTGLPVSGPSVPTTRVSRGCRNNNRRYIQPTVSERIDPPSPRLSTFRPRCELSQPQVTQITRVSGPEQPALATYPSLPPSYENALHSHAKEVPPSYYDVITYMV